MKDITVFIYDTYTYHIYNYDIKYNLDIFV